MLSENTSMSVQNKTGKIVSTLGSRNRAYSLRMLKIHFKVGLLSMLMSMIMSILFDYALLRIHIQYTLSMLMSILNEHTY